MAESDQTSFFWELLLSTLRVGLGDGEVAAVFGQEASKGAEGTSDLINQDIDEYIDTLDIRSELKSSIKSAIDEARTDVPFISTIVQAVQWANVQIAGIGAPMDVARQALTQSNLERAPISLADPQAIAIAQIVSGADLTEVPEDAQRHGLSGQQWNRLIESNRDVLAGSDIVNAFWRGELSEEVLPELFKRAGIFDQTTQKATFALNRFWPGVGDSSAGRFRGVFSSQETRDLYQGNGVDDRRGQQIFDLNRPIPSVNDAFELHRRGGTTDRADFRRQDAGEGVQSYEFGPDRSTFRGLLASQGYDQSSINQFEQIWPRQPDLRDLWESRRKNLISEQELERRLHGLGFAGSDAENMRKIRYFGPTPADLVRFGVKDVFNASVSAEFGVYEENPRQGGIGPQEAQQRFQQFLDDSGLLPEAWDIQWAAHWNLPAFGQIVEMIQRGIIPERDFNTWLKALDFSPGTRELLRQFFFRLIPRRTVTRMYRQRVLDEDQTIDRLLDLGFSPEDAALQIESADRRLADPQKEATKTDVINAYIDGIIDRESAIRSLLDIGLSQRAVELELAQAEQDIEADRGTVTLPRDREAEGEGIERTRDTILDGVRDGLLSETEATQRLITLGFSSEAADALIRSRLLEREFRRRDTIVDNLKDMFIEGVLDEDGIRRRFVEEGFAQGQAQIFLDQWAIERERRQRIEAKRDRQPTRAQLEDWLIKSIITVDEWRDRMADLGYPDDVVARFLQEIAIDNFGSVGA